jgi:hypothetical protein
MATQEQLDSMDWPSDPQTLCLHCGIKEPRRHSWFCRIECEDKYVELNVKH